MKQKLKQESKLEIVIWIISKSTESFYYRRKIEWRRKNYITKRISIRKQWAKIVKLSMELKQDSK